MLKTTVFAFLFVASLSALVIAGINFNVTKAVDNNSSGTPMGGIIWENTTWTLEDSPYIFVDNVIVSDGVTLIIEPGVVVNFDFWMLEVRGTLYARGNVTHKIVLYSYEQPLYAPRILFTSSSTPWDEIANTGCIIEHAKIEFYYHPTSMIRGGFVKISNNLIISHGETALEVHGIISNNTIIGYYRGICSDGNCLIINNIVRGVEHGIFVGGNYIGGEFVTSGKTTIISNLLIDNQKAISLWGGLLEIANNTLVRNAIGLYFSDNFDAGEFNDSKIIYNNIHNNTWLAYVEKEDPRISANVSYNWWGTTNTSLIDEKIYDQKDNRILSLVNFTPILTSAAISPPSLSSIQISTVTQEPEQDKVEPYQEVTVRANVTDQIIGVGNVMLGYSIDEGSTWNYSNMVYNETLGLYEGIIPGQPENTLVKYYVHASDVANDYYVNEDNHGQYYVYAVIPEFPSATIMLLLAIFSMLCTILGKKKLRKQT